MFSVLRNSNRLNLPLDIQIDLFNKMIKPILTYGSELWGFGNLDVIERVQLKYLKYIFKMKMSTPNCMVYGESGCMPVSIDIEHKMVSYWLRLLPDNVRELNINNNKLSTTVYEILFHKLSNLDPEMVKKQYPWFAAIKSIFVKCGMVNIWNSQSVNNTEWLKCSIKQKLKDLFINSWFSEVENSSSCLFYKILKNLFWV